MNVVFKFPVIIMFALLIVVTSICWVDSINHNILALPPVVTGTVGLVYIFYIGKKVEK